MFFKIESFQKVLFRRFSQISRIEDLRIDKKYNFTKNEFALNFDKKFIRIDEKMIQKQMELGGIEKFEKARCKEVDQFLSFFLQFNE